MYRSIYLLKLICLTFTVAPLLNSENVGCYIQNDEIEKCFNSSKFICTSGECIEEYQECDGRVDCQDASDESYSCRKFECHGRHFRCKYGACIAFDLQCNGEADCRDNSDETSPDCEHTSACFLPQHPAFGQLSIFGTPQHFVPRTEVASGTVVRLNCDDGYEVKGQHLIGCLDGKWTANIGQCTKTCPAVESTHSMKVTCYSTDGEIIDCHKPLDGSTAKFQCSPFYEDKELGTISVHLCRNGSWNQRLPQCVPVCGRKSITTTTLPNGTIVKEGHYPWEVALYTVHDKLLICGASLITQRIVLTAAHCITTFEGVLNDKDGYIVAVGKYYRAFDDSRDVNESQVSQLEAMFIPQNYKGGYLNYLGDIAVLVTKKSFILSRRCLPVCVDWGLYYTSKLYSTKATYGYVTGWGYTGENEGPSEVLKEIRVRTVTFEQCKQNLSHELKNYLVEDKFCADYSGQGEAVCKGDSGGGLVYKHHDKYYITGILSIGSKGGCNSQESAFYTNVYKYLQEFILDKVQRYKSPL